MLPAIARTANIGPCIGHYQAGPLQLGPSRYCCLPAKPTAVCAECRCSAHLFSSGVRTHNPTAPGPSLVTCTGANPVSVVFWHITVCMAQHRRILHVACGRHQCSSPVAIFALPSRLHCWCRRLVGYYSWPPLLSGGSGAGVEQSASTDQGRLVAVVFSAVDKGPSVSAVVQLTSDYCLPSFFINLICKVPL